MRSTQSTHPIETPFMWDHLGEDRSELDTEPGDDDLPNESDEDLHWGESSPDLSNVTESSSLDHEHPYQPVDEYQTVVPDYPPFDTEAFLGSLIDGARGALERGFVAAAIQGGQRDPLALTDLVFNRRHPERGGRRISRDEPNNDALVREWRGIKSGIVMPTLGTAATNLPHASTPTSQVHPPNDAGHWSAVRSRIVHVARSELSYWGNGSLRERQERGSERIEQYWRESLGWAPAGLTGEQLATKHAWSGVFICWVLKQAGVRDKIDFRFRGNHSNYLVDLLRLRTRDPGHPITLHDPMSVPLRPGDLINNWRQHETKTGQIIGGPFDLSTLRAFVDTNDLPHRPSHTDVVLEVHPGSHAVVIGGNKDGTVKTIPVAIDSRGVVLPKAWVAVVRVGP